MAWSMFGSPYYGRGVRFLGIALIFLSTASAAVLAAQLPPTATVQVIVTTQGNIPLGGVNVTVSSDAGPVATQVTDGEGKARFDALMPGKYTFVAALQGFDTATKPLVLAAGQAADLPLDLRIATLTDRVDVVAPTAVVPSTGTLTASEGLTQKQLDEISGGNGLQSALRLLVSVIEVPGGLAIKVDVRASRPCNLVPARLSIRRPASPRSRCPTMPLTR